MKSPAELFNKEHAASYDQRFAKVAAFRDTLHLAIRIVFSELPADSCILCVGVGTGAELIGLARAFPGFAFMAVEPSGPMLDVCRQRLGEEALLDRCSLHQGDIHSLPSGPQFHGATSLLVSQFLVSRPDRVAFFRGISQRLRPQGLLVTADLAGDLSSPSTDALKEAWRQMLVLCDLPAEQTNNYLSAWQRDVGVLPPRDVAAIITEGSFAPPTLILQTLFIHAWLAQPV